MNRGPPPSPAVASSAISLCCTSRGRRDGSRRIDRARVGRLGQLSLAEKDAGQHRPRKSSTIEGDEGFAPVATQRVNGARQPFLAGAALAGDQHRHAHLGCQSDLLGDAAHCRQVAGDGLDAVAAQHRLAQGQGRLGKCDGTRRGQGRSRGNAAEDEKQSALVAEREEIDVPPAPARVETRHPLSGLSGPAFGHLVGRAQELSEPVFPGFSVRAARATDDLPCLGESDSSEQFPRGVDEDDAAMAVEDEDRLGRTLKWPPGPPPEDLGRPTLVVRPTPDDPFRLGRLVHFRGPTGRRVQIGNQVITVATA